MIDAWLPDWPSWAIKLLCAMTGLLIVTYVLANACSPGDDEGTGNIQKERGKNLNKELQSKFNLFRRKYLIVYLIIMLADWMQGTHMYTLYLSYNVNISALFLTGFLTGAIFAPFLGSAVDKFGRKRSCIVYCVLEIIINLLEHCQDFRTLLVGRVLGGISTNLLFSSFESWMTTEHRHRGFPEEWLQRTYSATSIGNGTMAVLAGIVAQVLEDKLGNIGPFQGAVALTVLALIFILDWEENYGESKDGEHCSSSLYNQTKEGWKVTCTDSRIWRIGLTQALSEGAMYTFVFMWVPTLLSCEPPGGLPTGCVFSALMIAITIGGIIFPLLDLSVSRIVPKSKSSEMTATLTYTLAGLSLGWWLVCSMGRSKKKTAEESGSGPKPFCYFCDRDFENEDMLVRHQLGKHFSCPECAVGSNRGRCEGIHGLVGHMMKVHRRECKEVPNSIPGRGDLQTCLDLNIFGMSGVPEEMLRERGLLSTTPTAPLLRDQQDLHRRRTPRVFAVVVERISRAEPQHR